MSMQTMLNRVGGVAGALAVSLTALSQAIFTVEPGQRGLIFDRTRNGVLPYVLEEGVHACIPVLQKPVIYNVRITPKVFKKETGTKDLQTIRISLRVLYRPEIDRLPDTYRTLGVRYDETLLPSFCGEVMTATVAQFDASELITQREAVSRKIQENLVARSKEFGIVLSDVSITQVTFSNDFADSIERKQVAQQDAERSKYVVELAKQEKLAAIIRAEGEAEAARMISASTTQSFLDMRKIEAAKEIAAALSRSRNITYVPGGANMLLSTDGSSLRGGGARNEQR